jgi:hypothetical protein
MDFNKDRLEKLVDQIACNVEKDEDYGLKCLHINELNEKLGIFYEKYNPKNDVKTHEEILINAVSYLEKWGWNEASLEEEPGYLVTAQ